MKKSLERGSLLLALMIAVIVITALPLTAVQHKAIIIYHNDWSGAANALKTELQGRNYTVTMTDDAAQGLTAITNESNSLTTGDFLVTYLAGHGFNPRDNRNDKSKNTALNHFVQFNTGVIYVNQSAPLFEKIANKGVNLLVIDGSCNGGEAVLYAIGQKYCAVSTTGVYSPSLTNFPYPSNSIKKDSTPGKFGLWWDPHATASWMSGEIVFAIPMRINQRLFRNDSGDMANLSLFLRPSIGIMTCLELGGWNLHYQYCYLYPLIYPDEYAVLDATEKGKFTNSLPAFLSTMHTYSDPTEQFFTQLEGYLGNSSLLNQAASVYVANYEKVWQTLANDPGWEVNANPGKHAADMKGLAPDQYKGAADFLLIPGEIDSLMTVLKTGFDEQESLLKKIDAAVKGLYGKAKIIDLQKKKYLVKKTWPPQPGDPMKKYNQFERKMMERIRLVERELKLSPRVALKPVRKQYVFKTKTDLQIQKNKALQSVHELISLYQPGFKTQVKDNFGVSSAVLNAFKKQNLESLIAQFKAVTPALYYAEGRISFLLSILEDAISKIQGAAQCPCDKVQF